MNYTDRRTGQIYEDAPVAKEPKQVNCRHCYRPVISDGHNGVVHEEDYRYQCEGQPAGTFAEARV